MPSATANAERRQRQIAEEIAALGPCLPGSLVERTTRCGSTRCRCRTDPAQMHGPYPTWIRKAGTRTVTRTLSPAQLERYRPLFDNAKRLRELTSELETLTAEIVEQAEGWTAPQDDPRDLQRLQRRRTPDNVSSLRPQSCGAYSKDTQIRTPDNGGYARVLGPSLLLYKFARRWTCAATACQGPSRAQAPANLHTAVLRAPF